MPGVDEDHGIEKGVTWECSCTTVVRKNLLPAFMVKCNSQEWWATQTLLVALNGNGFFLLIFQ